MTKTASSFDTEITVLQTTQVYTIITGQQKCHNVIQDRSTDMWSVEQP
jgi:hypothetical protein